MHVAFDIGNVLAKVDLTKFTSKLEMVLKDHRESHMRHFHESHEDEPMFFLNALQALQDLGITTVREALRHRYPFLSIAKLDFLIEAWLEVVQPSDMMLNFMDDLRSQGVKIALLSNIGPEHAGYLRKTCPRMFDGVYEHLSFEVGARKPSKLYYQSFLMDHSEFIGAVYLDDRDENLRAGKKYSFKSFGFNLDEIDSMPQSKRRLELRKARSYIFDRKYDNVPCDKEE